MNDTLNNTLSSKHTPYKPGLVQKRKKKANALVLKVSERSKLISKGCGYAEKLKKRAKSKNLKGRAQRSEKSRTQAMLMATMKKKKIKNKQKNKLNKTHNGAWQRFGRAPRYSSLRMLPTRRSLRAEDVAD